MGFQNDLRRSTQTLLAESRAIVNDASKALYDSIRDGSPVTGAPGQPRHTDELYNSWKLTETPNGVRIASDSDHAWVIEDNIRGVHYHNGGPHSVALSVAGFDRLLDAARSRRGA